MRGFVSLLQRRHEKTVLRVRLHATDIPDPSTLKQFIPDNFTSSPKNFAFQKGVLKELLPKTCSRFRLFMGIWDLSAAECRYDAFGFEISRPCAEPGDFR